ncbi:hypothetical protein PTSG_01674 [Salpingoeca rosetta]|uniref:Uncharacterized protein n=1 Tax=Salpingoeca rosetta (strain ATCC 50818 / BSB-021) TaxID=946362 RepID=F2TYM2_SALR5|nr:uncharacterized protein PTSG_01674 [Salpingoeca rosetta]EGD78696.1 hypothetical protein PTSG_01674 [Salpingoeca rosetta]|eukprot:XP_004997653.1 hypothetical protein PTSG_01674 [Salpingoeca rosetta]
MRLRPQTMTMVKRLAAVAVLALGMIAMQASVTTASSNKDESTWSSLQHNVLSYLILIIPAGLFVRYVKQHPGHGTFFDCVAFTMEHPDFMMQAIILSITSATGQMFIFYTLATYGALVFAIIMTRQVISIFVSAVVFGHVFAPQGWLGIAVVFVALFSRIYLRTSNRGKK